MATRTVTLRLKDDVYSLFHRMAEQENRPLSNFIETATLKHIEQTESVDEFEMADILGNKELARSLKAALKDARNKKGRFVG